MKGATSRLRRRWAWVGLAVACSLLAGIVGIELSGSPPAEAVSAGAGATMSQNGYVASTCTPTLSSFDQYGPALTADESIAGAVAPALGTNGTMAVVVPSTTYDKGTPVDSLTYYQAVDELSSAGSVVWTIPIPTSSVLTLGMANSTIAILGSGPGGNFLEFADTANQTVSTVTLDPLSQYDMVTTPDAFVVTHWLGRDETAGPGDFSVYSASGQLMSNTQFQDTSGEASVQAATDGSTAYVYYALSKGATAGAYPAGLYAVNGTTGAVSGPYSFTLAGLWDQLSLLPNNELLFHAPGPGTSTAQLIQVHSNGVVTVWQSTGDFSGAAVYDGTSVLLSGGLFATPGDNPATDVVGVTGQKTLSTATGAVSAAATLANITAPLWPIAAGPWGSVDMVQQVSPVLDVFNTQGSVAATYPVPDNVGAEGWIYNLGTQTVELSPLFPGKALTWATGCTG